MPGRLGPPPLGPGGGHPDDGTCRRASVVADTLPPGLSFRQSRYGSDQSLVSAGAMLTSLPVDVVYLVFPRHLISGLTAGVAEG